MEATAEQPVIIVSQDGDFAAPAKEALHVTVVKSLPKLFEALGLEMDAPEIAAFLEDDSRLLKAVQEELSDLMLFGDVPDSEIDEATATGLRIKWITAFRPTTRHDPILVVGSVLADVTASYTHPDWETALYDSEDQVLVPFGHVSGEIERELDIDIALSITVDEEGNPEEIEELRFRNEGFDYITIHEREW